VQLTTANERDTSTGAGKKSLPEHANSTRPFAHIASNQ